MGVKNLAFVDNSAPPCDAAYLNSVKSEINNTITSTGASLSDANLSQLAAALAAYAAGADYYTESGVADAYVVSPVGSKSAPIAYFVGMRVRFMAGNTSTGASTINVNSLGVESIKQANGTDPITAGDIPAGVEVTLVYDGTNFRITLGNPIAAATNPTGALIAYAGTTAPAGWLLCYGQAVSRTTYADLFALTGTVYGVGDGSTTFNLPDYRGRALVGLDNLGGSSANRITSAQADSLNNTGFGSETDAGTNGTTGAHTLTAAEIPSLDAYTRYYNAAATYNGNYNSLSTKLLAGVDTITPVADLTVTTAIEGGGGSHTHTGSTWTGTTGSNAQPSLAAGIIIKT